jgi:hypothetical protein
MKSEDRRLMLAGNALSGLLASQGNKGWEIGTLAVLSLTIADTIIKVSELKELPELSDGSKNSDDSQQLEFEFVPKENE